MQNIIYSAYHLDGVIPNVESIYKPYQVGSIVSNKKFLELNDASMIDNISSKNSTFSELTLQYFVWKNVNNLNNVGISHYRRLFNPACSATLIQKFDSKITYEYDKCSRPETKYSKEIYDFVTSIESTNLLDQLLVSENNTLVTLTPFEKTNKYPLLSLVQIGWLPAHAVIVFFDVCESIMTSYEFDEFMKIMNRQNHHYCNNMIYTSKKIFDDYSEWLFRILFEFERRLSLHSPQMITPRMFGYFSEYMLKPYTILKSVNVKHVESICFNDMKIDTRI